MQLRLISPDKIHYDGHVDSVSVPGLYKNFTVLNNHGPIISVLEKGVVSYEHDGSKEDLNISSGFVDVRDNNVFVCVELPYDK